MTYFSENSYMEIGLNYTRGMLCDYMDIKYCKDDIERGIYKPSRYSSVFIFSTIQNTWGYFNGRLSDNTFLFSSNGNYLDSKVTQHQQMNYELLLFVRHSEETGFYYFGRCNYSDEYKVSTYRFPLYGLELMDTNFSCFKGFDIPGVG